MYFAIFRLNYNIFIVFNTENVFFAPAFKLYNQNSFSGHKNTHIKLTAKKLAVPVDDVVVI